MNRIKGGRMIGTRPVPSETWIFTTDNPDVSDALAGHFRGKVETTGEEHRVTSAADTVAVLLDSPDALVARMVVDTTTATRRTYPEITITCKLANDPDLGPFTYRTGSWSLVGDLPQIERDLAAAFTEAAGPVTVTMKLARVERAESSYMRPVLQVGMR